MTLPNGEKSAQAPSSSCCSCASDEQIVTIATWNNTAVQCYEEGRLPESMARFRCALNLVTSSGTGQELTDLPFTPQSPIDPLEPLRKAKHFLQTDENTNLFVYAHPIELDVRPGAYSSSPVANHMILSAIIIWNMAVVFHGKSSLSGTTEKDMRRLNKAYSLYMNSLSLVEQVLHHGSYGNPVVDLFAQALLHNLWDCCKRLQWETQSEEWNDRLLRYSVSIRHHYRDLPEVLSILQGQSHQFAVNTLLGGQLRFLGAAAAA